ncbi:MAG TPA: tetratricopeptide repeat protein [bacterium]
MSSTKFTVIFSAMILATTVSSLMGQNNKTYTQQEANSFLQAGDWKNAALAYASLVKQDAKNGQAWLQLGLSHHNLKEYDKAIKAYEEADNLQFAQWRARYNTACALALMDKKDEAFTWLDKALAAGFSQPQLLESDTDLASLREDARFKHVLEVADKNARPCEYSEKHRAFDFWIGEWEVFNPQGQQIGANVIEKILNGCVLYENWTSARSGYFGKSFNYYEPSAGRWKQNWVDATGGIVWYAGEVKDGVMHFAGENISMDGSKQLARVTFTPLPDGRVHHVIEQSADDGKTWSVYFDGMYVKKNTNGSTMNK